MQTGIVTRYFVAAGLVAFAFGLKFALGPQIEQEMPFLMVLAAIMLSAWFGGVGPGIFATILAGVGTEQLYISVGSGWELLTPALYVLEAAVIVVAVTGFRAGLESAERRTDEARQNQEALRSSEERYRSVVEQAAEGIFLVDVDTKAILQSNTAFRELLGYSVEDLENMTAYQIVGHPRDSVDENLRTLVQRRRYFSGDREYIRKDGESVSVEVSTSVVTYGGRQVFCIVVHDVTARTATEEHLKRSLNSLTALHEANQFFGGTLDRTEIYDHLLRISEQFCSPDAACVSLFDDTGELRTWRESRNSSLLAIVRDSPEARAARQSAIEGSSPRPYVAGSGDGGVGLCIPMRGVGRLVGVIELFGAGSLSDVDLTETLCSLRERTTSAFENARYYEELAFSERRLKNLIGQMIVAQEEERRRVAYEVHDGATQLAVAAYQRLQDLTENCAISDAQGKANLEEATQMVKSMVGDLRCLIANLRPTVLDDLGLSAAVKHQAMSLRKDGCDVSFEGFEGTLPDDSLPLEVEMTVFRISQEAISNVRKHARTARVRVSISLLMGAVRLEVEDWGRGFVDERGDTRHPGERIGLSSMRERASLLGGETGNIQRTGRGNEGGGRNTLVAGATAGRSRRCCTKTDIKPNAKPG